MLRHLILSFESCKDQTQTMKPVSSRKNKNRLSTKEKGAAGPFDVAAVWPHHECPFLLSMVGGREIFIATSFTPIDFDDLGKIPLKQWVCTEHSPQEKTDFARWLALLPYEAYGDAPTRAQNTDRPMAWEIYAGLTWKQGEASPIYNERINAKKARFHLGEGRIKEIIKMARDVDLDHPKPIALVPTASDESYLATVQNVIRSIGDGDFYQVNLLRFFFASSPQTWQNLCALMKSNSGPHGILLALGNRIISSFSPERFIEIKQTPSCAEIVTWPIKGTIPRHLTNEDLDKRAGQALSESEKDQAELQMIMDLMRNDFTKICTPNSVKVIEKSALKKFAHVWHLEGQVVGILKASQTLHSVLEALCPGGSISGAPKLAAMQRIAQEEGRPRGYFMGNFLRINHDGSLQSNILIRTLLSDNWLRSASYAAGSGIVIKSEPISELKEVVAKCSTITLGQLTPSILGSDDQISEDDE